MKPSLFPTIEGIIQTLDVLSISAERKSALQVLIDYITEKVEKNDEVRLNFICTHNSRRSHLTQVWAQTLAAWYGIPNVFTYSGGTEATAMFPLVGGTLKAQGFEVTPLSEDNNPVYAIKYGQNHPPIIGFSKVYDHPFNPMAQFAAAMTCAQADEGCPFIAGAEKRVSIPYDDPKMHDNTPQQVAKYMERSLQIATELSYVFSRISQK